jgi:pimeloyl-ACP methyl ester carboxylesterase
MSQELQVTTADMAGQLSCQIDFPEQGAPRAFAVLTPGSGLHDRHVLAGESDTPKDFFFDTLSMAFLELGIATIRYDNRGVRGNRKSAELLAIDNAGDRERKFMQDFIDSKLRLTVTPATQVDDLYSIYNFAKTLSQEKKLILVGHSEGCLNIARMISKYGLQNEKVLFLSPAFESPKSLVWWQRVGRLGSWLRELAPNQGDITIEDVRKGFGYSKLSSLYTIEHFLPHGGVWTEEMLAKKERKLEEDYQRDVSWIVKQDDKDPWPGPYTYASFSWWKQWHLDEKTLDHYLADFSGDMKCIFGEFDTQVEYARQIVHFPQSSACNFSAKILPGVGHTFGYHGLLGPPEDWVVEEIKQSIETLAC